MEGYQKGDADVGEESTGQNRRQEGSAETDPKDQRQGSQGTHRTRKGRDGGARPRTEGPRAPRTARGEGGRGKRGARENCRAAGTGADYGRAAPRHHQSQRASPLVENLVRDARVCQGRQGRLLLPKRAEV